MKLGVFDLETTGVDVNTARIVSAYVGIITENGIESGQAFLVDPGIDIPDAAAAVHGISTVQAQAYGRPADEAIPDIAEHLNRAFAETDGVVAFNAAYDFTVFDRELRRHGMNWFREPMPVIDPFVIDKALDRYREGSRTLSADCAHYGIPLTSAHDAGADAVAAGRLALRLLQAPHIVNSVPEGESITHLVHRWSIVWRRRQQEGLAIYFRDQGKSFDDVHPQWPIIPAPIIT